jgi:hypothetical protein
MEHLSSKGMKPNYWVISCIVVMMAALVVGGFAFCSAPSTVKSCLKAFSQKWLIKFMISFNKQLRHPLWRYQNLLVSALFRIPFE